MTPVEEQKASQRRWYIVHTYSGFEERVRETLRQRADALGMGEAFGDIRIPTETVVEYKSGKKREIERKFFPGYILVEMEMSDAAWHVVKNTPKVTGFVGTGKKPTPLTQEEVDQILEQVAYGEGEAEAEVRVRQGRAGEDHRRAVQQLHGRRRRGQPGSQHLEGDGHDLRATDPGRAGLLAGPETVAAHEPFESDKPGNQALQGRGRWRRKSPE